MIRYKIDLLKAAKDLGYTAKMLREQKGIAEFSMQSIRHGKMISMDTLSKFCDLLAMQPGDIIEWIPDYEPKTEK